MKKRMGLFLALVMLIMSAMDGTTLYASARKTETRAIAIVFDNSGSMYDDGDKAWCRATYAMEVFASMLNTGDTLEIYPMHPIKVGNKKYTMNKPFRISDAKQASEIRKIFTEDTGGTPIESIDCAAKGLKSIKAQKKYMVVLTDGDTFSKSKQTLNKDKTKSELDKRIKKYAGKSMTVMYLGIGADACVPRSKQSDYFVKKRAVDTSDVLSTLTEMCNWIFGRDVLPKNHIKGNNMDFDISMNKLIVFVQGNNISNLKIKPKDGKSIGKLVSSQQTKYSTKGAGDYKSVPDKSLQGMMVTYEDCDAGNYEINYKGKATSVEVYYEPNADLEFIFTDSNGKDVDLNSLYEGKYKVSFGMKDGKTGKLIESDLLGNPHYEGSYTINGKKTKFKHDGYSGEVPVELAMNDTFEADLTVTYLSGYTISKNSTDFGWPKGGVKVIAPPLGDFGIKLTIQQDYILIKELDESKAMTVDVAINGNKLTAEEFDSVKLTADCGGIKNTITPNKSNSSYTLKLNSTDGIKAGNYKINVRADYLDRGGRTAQAEADANVTLSNKPLWVKWLIGLLLLLLLAIIIWIISHIKVLPTRMHTTRKLSSMNFDGDDVTQSTSFAAELKKKNAKVQGKYGGKKFGIAMDVVPGKESYLYKSQKRRSAEVKPGSIRKFGNAKIQEAMIGSAKYVMDENTGKLVPAIPNQKPFKLTNGMRVKFSGTMQDAGIDKDFELMSQLNFKKK